MNWFANLRTAVKLGIGFGVLALALLGTGLFGLTRINDLSATVHTLYRSTKVEAKIGDVRDDILNYEVAEKDLLFASTRSGMQQYQSQIDKSAQDYAADNADLKTMVSDPAIKQKVEDLDSLWSSYKATCSQAVTLALQNKGHEAQRLYKSQAAPELAGVRNGAKSVAQMIVQTGKNDENLAIKSEAASRTHIGTITILALIAAIMFGMLITFVIVRPLHDISARMEQLRDVCATNLQQALDALGHCDLTVSVQPATQPLTLDRKDEIGVLAKTFNSVLGMLQASIFSYEDARKSLSELIGSVAQNSEDVAETSVQMTSSSQQSSRATEEIARSMQEVASAAGQSASTSQQMAQASEQQAKSATAAAAEMAHLHNDVKQMLTSGKQQLEAALQASSAMQQSAKAVEEVARSSQQMADGARRASSVAQTGGSSVEQTVASMARIKEQVDISAARVAELGKMGEAIGAIVETIDQIAEQTNLLALNAAIEAARAGEHGRGFAVVADEVRKLAERSTTATSEVSSLISRIRQGVEESIKAMSASSREVSDGSARSTEAGGALVQILAAAQSVASEVETVSSISEQMAASVQEVNAIMETVRQLTEQNTKVVEGMAGRADTVSAAIASVASVSEQTAAGAQEMSASAEEVAASAQNVSASVEEQTASIQEVNASSVELSRTAGYLRELVLQFKVDGDERQHAPKMTVVQGRDRKAA
jgi:methyl-accepting chemotaxis protein